MKKYKAIALFSGGLDSMLSVLWMQKLGYNVLPVFFKTYFFNERRAKSVADAIGLNLIVADVGEEMLKVMENPRYGFGKYKNPCIDCHSLMFRQAGKMMEELNADFLISGEVLGQRPMSQRMDAMNAVSKYSGYKNYIIRPLSQKLLPDTLPITKGWVDKNELLDIQGRGRKRQMELAEEFGIKEYQTPGGGCFLTEKVYSLRLCDLIEYKWLKKEYIAYLPYGRHFRISSNTKLIIGRNQNDNESIFQISNDVVMLKVNRAEGPLGVINSVVENDASYSFEKDLYTSASIFLHYANKAEETDEVKIIYPDNKTEIIQVTKMKKNEINKYWITPS